jgi:hypothetical protein
LLAKLSSAESGFVSQPNLCDVGNARPALTLGRSYSDLPSYSLRIFQAVYQCLFSGVFRVHPSLFYDFTLFRLLQSGGILASCFLFSRHKNRPDYTTPLHETARHKHDDGFNGIMPSI